MTAMNVAAQPPRSIEAEQVVLASMIAAPPLIGDVAGVIAPDDFYEPRHATIMEHLQWLDNESLPVEPASLIDRMRSHGDLDKCGGPEYIVRLFRQASPQNTMYYANIIAEKSATRQVINLHQQGIRNAQDGNGMDLRALVQETHAALDQITEKQVSSDVVRAGHTIDATIDRIDELGKSSGGVTGVRTGFYDLDRMTHGLHAGQMIVIAARPAVGKSTLGLDVVRNAAIRHGVPSLLCSLEMSVDEINMRLLSAEAQVELGHIRSGRVKAEEWERIARKQQAIIDAPLFYDDTASNTMSQIRQKAKRIQQKHGLGLIVIDYLQLMQGDRRVDSRQQEVSEISRGIKLLAKELEIPVIAMSQLNRGSENRTDNRPKVSDLRESGSIEQDADVVMLIHREDLYDPDSTRVGEADIIIGKQRSGPQGTVVLGFQGGFSRFADMTQETEPGGF